MSNEDSDLLYQGEAQRGSSNHSFFRVDNNSLMIQTPIMINSPIQSPHRFDPSYNSSFTDLFHNPPMEYYYNSFTPCPLDGFEMISPCPIMDEDQDTSIKSSFLRDSLFGTSENPLTPNSSVSSSSTEAIIAKDDLGKCKKYDQLPKECDGDQLSKKVNDGKSKKRGEKRQREPRFAFVTKSEIDNLEDGYRWRKYGQKAVKNSPYPRSYYRCTSQKCTVKKRVERSFEDPSTVVTTYEGQHNHHCPATLRGNAMLSSSSSSPHTLFAPSGLATLPNYPRQQLISHMLPMNNHSNTYFRNPNNNNNNNASSQVQLQVPDYGLLQDMVPSFISNQDT